MQNKKLDLMPVEKLVDLFIQEEKKTINELKHQKNNIVKVIKQLIENLKRNGRIIYIGSGTSGRLGILDAVECKPTFNTNLFNAIIAGGNSAIFQAKEGVEDNIKQAIKDLQKIKLKKNDVIIGISASGETPYTLSAIKYGKKGKILTIAITSNPNSTISRVASYHISPLINQEIISGSSRLRSGTAQKIILNMLSSITMIKRGKVFNNLMLEVQPTNEKLIKRAIGIISSICKLSLNKAAYLFAKAKKNTKAAIVMHFKKCDLKTAKSLLQKANFNIREIIG